MSLTSDDFNPYAAPAADLAPAATGEVHGAGRAGNDLILTRTDSELPDRCMKCNAPAGGYRLKKKLSWHPSGYYILLVFNVLIYLVVALIVRKTAKVRFPLCPKHRSRRRWAIALGWLLGLGSFPVMIGLAVASSNAKGQGSDTLAVVSIITGIGMIVAGLVIGFQGAKVATTSKIDKQYVYLTNVGREFVASLPPFSG